MQQLTNMKEGWHITSSYPTRSLKEYLAYRSAERDPDPPASAPPRIEVEVDVGDGRSQVIVVDARTDIEREAEEFCRRHHLEEYVSELLAQTIREQYQQELEEAHSREVAHMHQSLAETHTNPHARQVLIPNSEREDSGRNLFGESGESGRSTEKGAQRILQGYHHSRAKKYSLGENYLLQNKENRPELNKVSLQICEKLGKENILEQRSRRSREKRRALVRELQAREEELMRECPFQPKINAISKQVDREIASSAVQQRAERFERLYDDHRQMELRREEERQNYLQELPFRPALNYISRKIVEGKRAANDSQERLEKKSHMACSHSSNGSLPHTGRKPRNRNADNLPIGDYLYAQAMKKSRPKPHAPRAEIRALDHSDHLVAVLKEKRINEIFSELTQSPHEELFCEDVDLDDEMFKTGRYRLFAPIFNEMAAMGISLTRSEFLEASLSLIKTMSPEQKHEVIFPREKKAPNLEPQPVLAGSKSREKLKRSGFEEADIYSRGVEHRKSVAEKNEKQRENRARDELRQCTFRPTLKPN